MQMKKSLVTAFAFASTLPLAAVPCTAMAAEQAASPTPKTEEAAVAPEQRIQAMRERIQQMQQIRDPEKHRQLMEAQMKDMQALMQESGGAAMGPGMMHPGMGMAPGMMHPGMGMAPAMMGYPMGYGMGMGPAMMGYGMDMGPATMHHGPMKHESADCPPHQGSGAMGPGMMHPMHNAMQQRLEKIEQRLNKIERNRSGNASKSGGK